MLIRYCAAARAAAGTDSDTLPLHRPTTRRQVEAILARTHPHPPPGQPPLAQVLARSSYLLDGTACPDPHTVLTDTAVLDVLPPFSDG
ncbi:MoaD/ThiS family protein [Kocuria sp. KH4]